MTREEFIKQRCEIDKITEEEFEKQYRVIKCDCGQPYCKGYRCLDLDGLLRDNQELRDKIDRYENPEDMTLMMMWCTEKVKDENEKLKQQLHESSLTIQEMAEQDIECPSNCEKLRQLKKLNEEKTKIGIADHKYASKCEDKVVVMEAQQKEFIKYLEDYQDGASKSLDSYDCGINDCLGDVLSKYKEIVNGLNRSERRYKEW